MRTVQNFCSNIASNPHAISDQPLSVNGCNITTFLSVLSAVYAPLFRKSSTLNPQQSRTKTTLFLYLETYGAGLISAIGQLLRVAPTVLISNTFPLPQSGSLQLLQCLVFIGEIHTRGILSWAIWGRGIELSARKRRLLHLQLQK